MYFTSKLFAPMTSENVEKKGQTFYKAGKIGMLCGLAGIGLLVVVVLITFLIATLRSPSYAWEIVGGTLAFLYDDALVFIAYPFIAVSYLCILFGLVGIPLYFYGINLFALGRIAHNTEKA